MAKSTVSNEVSGQINLPPSGSSGQVIATQDREIRVLVVDDHKLFRKGVISILNDLPGISVVAERSNGQEAVNLMREGHWEVDVILMDIEMPQLDGISATVAIRKFNSEVRILALTQYDEDNFIIEMLRRGANGYLLKEVTGPDQLAEAVRTVVSDQFYFSKRISMTMLKTISSVKEISFSKGENLTLKSIEIDLLRLICQELTSKEIADRLCRSPRTIESYRKDLMQKLGVKSVVGLVLFAIKRGYCSE